MAEELSFVVYSRGAPQGSKRNLGNGIMVEASKRVKPFRADVRGAALLTVPTDWDLGLTYHLDVAFHFMRPKSHFTSKGALTKAAPMYPTGRQIGDTDKLIRSVCDALTGITWHDDSAVVDITAAKRFHSRDQTIITIECLN